MLREPLWIYLKFGQIGIVYAEEGYSQIGTLSFSVGLAQTLLSTKNVRKLTFKQQEHSLKCFSQIRFKMLWDTCFFQMLTYKFKMIFIMLLSDFEHAKTCVELNDRPTLQERQTYISTYGNACCS